MQLGKKAPAVGGEDTQVSGTEIKWLSQQQMNSGSSRIQGESLSALIPRDDKDDKRK